MTMPLNLPGLAAEAAAEDHAATAPLRNRDGEAYQRGNGEPVTISVLGEYSKAVRKAQDANARRLLRQRRPELTPESMLENRLHIAVAALSGWTLEDAEHQPVPFTPENVRAVCALAPWVLDQIEELMRGHAGFFGTSSAG